MKPQVKIIKCRNCGEVFQADPGNLSLSLESVAAVSAIGAVVGSVVPGIGTVFGAMLGAKCAVDAMRGSCVCPRCGRVNDANSTKS